MTQKNDLSSSAAERLPQSISGLIDFSPALLTVPDGLLD
jgi:hypothetical protein